LEAATPFGKKKPETKLLQLSYLQQDVKITLKRERHPESREHFLNQRERQKKMDSEIRPLFLSVGSG
jgi:hypothetical protein